MIPSKVGTIVEDGANNQLSDDIDAAVARVRDVQRKRTLASLASLAVALAIIVPGEALVMFIAGNARSFPVIIFAAPFILGLPPAWAVRTALWPKDAVI